jgi:excisionase family DNA binding protein
LMGQTTAGIPAPAAAGAPAAAPAAAPELLTPAQVAQRLGVGEADVMASLESGDLKGKKIGTQWRVTRAAVDAFLSS